MMWDQSGHSQSSGTAQSPSTPGQLHHLLLVSADHSVVDLMDQALADAGYVLHVFTRSDSAGVRVFAQRVDVLIVDLACAASPWSHRELTRIVQLAGCPCLALTGRGHLDQRMMALQGGAAVVLGRPLQPAEFVACLGALVAAKPNEDRSSAVFLSPGVAVDAGSSVLACHDYLISLTAQESVLLRHLAQNINRIVGYTILCDILDLRSTSSGLMALRQLIARLRRKLDGDPTQSLHLYTERHLGYGLSVRADAAAAKAPCAQT